eukprot:4086602-Pyramimonas_sp.AAC.1
MRIRRLAKAWNNKQRTICLRGIVGQNGFTHTEPSVCAQLLCSHWGSVFGARAGSADPGGQYLGLVPPVDPD